MALSLQFTFRPPEPAFHRPLGQVLCMRGRRGLWSPFSAPPGAMTLSKSLCTWKSSLLFWRTWECPFPCSSTSVSHQVPGLLTALMPSAGRAGQAGVRGQALCASLNAPRGLGCAVCRAPCSVDTALSAAGVCGPLAGQRHGRAQYRPRAKFCRWLVNSANSWRCIAAQ